ncbi:disease resistance protein RPV1 [Cryptomeria japonica]|uniref:disease resistance protein RPV1 n=1 Tax=Cryptomeria japonica TaxID=3369 RepID=UPI0027D9E2D9|nr:disease resistance protein RPV1 [Cryptomeria japonica]
MGGSGKTTLAKELYNEISFSMDKSSFVFDVRDAATKGLLHEKQKKLLNDLGVQGLAFDNIEDGVRNLSRGLRSVRVLIVLDDVDNMEQFDALLPTKDNLQKGSLIIVTTRVCDTLKSWGISSIYKMRQLDPLYAKQLFCWHAFLKPNPLDGFKELVEQFLEVCNGLPLSLKVFGAQLYGESRKEYWKSQLHKISKILPNDIKQRLKISYDCLDNEEKEMFLDTACFFIGQEKSLTIEIWNGMGWSALQSWERLLHRCLVELDNKNCIRMHDHIRDLGRDIASKHSPYRLWFPQQMIDVQKQIKKRIGIQGIVATLSQIHLDDYYQVPVVTDKTDEVDGFRVCCLDGKLMVNTNGGIWSLTPSLVGLKYLVASGDNFNQVMSDISREMIWLRWFQIGQRNLPSKLPLRNLRVLELSERSDAEHHHLEELWGETDGKGPLQLRQLLISHCHNFQGFPNSIGFLIHLKKIVIIESHNLTSLPDEFCHLQSLERLVLFLCKRLSSLPSNFGNLSNLWHLNLWNCMELRGLPVTFKNLKLLKYLNLGRCSQLTFTTEDLNFLENVTKLEFLNLSQCKKLEELPRQVTNQASLRELYFSGTSLRELPDDIGQLKRLTGMTIHHLSLTSLPTSLGDLSSLTYLVIRDCPRLECLGVKCLPESIRQLKNLQELRLYDCPISELDFGAASLPRYGLSKLKQIALKETEVCRISFSEDCCPHLESLRLFNNHHLKEIEELPRTLKSICLENSEMLKNIPSFAGFTSLRKFHLRGCYGIEKIEGLENCTRLEKLTVETCWEVPGIESLEHMQNLKKLKLRANNGSVIERCIHRIRKCADEEIIICARAVPDAASLVHSSLSPNLIIVDSISNQNIKSRPKLLLKSPTNDDAIMFCCVINCVSSQMTLRSKRKEYSVEVGKGRWALVGVVTQRCIGIEEEDCGQVEFSIRGHEYVEYWGEVEKGLVVRGAEQAAVEAFRSLLPLLLQS